MKEKTKLDLALDELLSQKDTEEIVALNALLVRLVKTLREGSIKAELKQCWGSEKEGNSQSGRDA